MDVILNHNTAARIPEAYVPHQPSLCREVAWLLSFEPHLPVLLLLILKLLKRVAEIPLPRIPLSVIRRAPITWNLGIGTYL